MMESNTENGIYSSATDALKGVNRDKADQGQLGHFEDESRAISIARYVRHGRLNRERNS